MASKLLVWREREGPTGSVRCSVFCASVWTCWDGCVCACVVEVGVDHLVSNDLRERRVACACVFARGRICVDVGARVPAWTRTIVCLCPSAPIGRACALAMLAHEPARIRLVYSSTSPPSCIRPSVHPSIRQSVCLSRIRPSIPVRSIVFPIPKEGAKNQLSFSWAAGTQSSPDGGSQRFTHLPADTARLGKKGALSHPPGHLPPSEGPSRPLLPPWSPESFL